MTSRERTLAVMRGLPADRPPVMYWLNPHTTCRLIAEYQPAKNAAVTRAAKWMWRRFLRGGQGNAGDLARLLPFLLDEYGNAEYALELGADIAILSPALSSAGAFAGSVRRRGGRLQVRGPFGGTMSLAGIYMCVTDTPVKNARDLARYRLSDVRGGLFDGIRRFRERHPDAFIAVECLSLQQAVCDFILGTERFMTALYDSPREIAAFFARMADWIAAIIAQEAAAGADAVFFQDDYGTTGSTLIAPDMWANLMLPHLRRLIAEAHSLGVPFMLHSCGYQMPLLEHYAAAGLDCLQSLQPKAGNDFRLAYERYGDRITLATGIDIQRGEGMTPDEIAAGIREIYAMAEGKGRFILAMTHMMQYTMPAPNYRSIFETVEDIKAGACQARGAARERLDPGRGAGMLSSHEG